MSFMLNAYSGDTRSPIPVISVHSSGSLVCQPRPINVLTFNVFKNACAYLGWKFYLKHAHTPATTVHGKVNNSKKRVILIESKLA